MANHASIRVVACGVPLVLFSRFPVAGALRTTLAEDCTGEYDAGKYPIRLAELVCRDKVFADLFSKVKQLGNGNRQAESDLIRGASVSNKTSSQPKYLAIANALIHSIRKGDLSPGTRVPSENEIIADHGVSNTTARRALSYLQSHGWIRRQRGSGSFVHPRCLDLSLDRILDFDASVLHAGGTPSTQLVSFQSAEETPLLRVAGNTYALEGLVHRIERLCFADGVPMMLERRYVSAAHCPDIEQHDLTDPLYELYENTYGLILSEVRQDLSVVTLDSGRTMEQFELDEPIPAIRVQGATLSADGQIVELEDAFYRSDRYRFTVVARR